MEFIKKVISSVGVGFSGLASNFPYVIEDPSCPAGTDFFWSIHSGHAVANKEDKVTIFIGRFDKDPDRRQYLTNALRRIKTLRHPNIFRYINSVETENEIMIAIERVYPLTSKLGDIRKNSEVLLWITFLIIKTLKFLHNEAGMIHGNVCLSSMFVTDSGELRMGGLELCSSTKVPEDLVSKAYSMFAFSSDQHFPPELSKNASWSLTQSSSGYSLDSFMLGHLVQSMFSGVTLPAELRAFIKGSQNIDPSKRPNSSDLLDCSFFKTKLIYLSESLNELTAMDGTTRDAFLRDLQGSLGQLPQQFTSFKVLPALTLVLENSTEVDVEGIKLFCVCASRLSQADFNRKALSTIKFLFSRPDRAVRVAILDNISLLISLLEPKAIQNAIYPLFLSGFTDAEPIVREHTLRVSALLAPKLSQKQLNGELPRVYGRLQSDERPSIRVNAIVCIGKMFSLFDNTAKKVLIGAFTRAMKDPFAPARSAALSAISVTFNDLDPTDLATVLLPVAVTLLVDSEPSVRQASPTIVRRLIDHVISHVDNMTVTDPGIDYQHSCPKKESFHDPSAILCSASTDKLQESLNNSRGHGFAPVKSLGPRKHSLVAYEGFQKEVPGTGRDDDHMTALKHEQMAFDDPWSDVSNGANISPRFPASTSPNNTIRGPRPSSGRLVLGKGKTSDNI